MQAAPDTLAGWMTLCGFGFGVGFVSGMFGVGGGFILTPLLHVVFGLPLPVAVGSGLCQMIGTGVSAYLRHQGLRQGEPRVDWIMVGGSLCGVWLGVAVLAKLGAIAPIRVMDRSIPAIKLVMQPAYAVALLGVARLMATESRIPKSVAVLSPTSQRSPLARVRIPPLIDLPQVGITGVSVPVIAYLGLALGFLSGLLGIGGGIMLMPVLVYGLGFSFHQAAGTGILVLIITAALGTFAHALAGHVDLAIVIPLLLGSSVGAQLGAVTTARLEASRLRGYFVGVILLTVFALIYDLARSLAG